ncbi:bestrophin family protein [Robertkochia solimangrovi]|uniref:bestrophin family protein n=1 Tax=Robertkochia solimangrovi TaxID=2213046 RepID=UPI0011802F41|nr:bestrophin family ion channel [Robertkochia solimangrovi]TRZ45889.1 hypothetical protein DMZ48_01030 [Robertkochia solimangrovi]
MLISNRVNIHNIVSGTGSHFLVDLTLCVSTYVLYLLIPDSKIGIPVLIPSVLGTALAFFIGFKNNQAYDRWWEARKIWGALVNDSRTWARQVIYFIETNHTGPEPDRVIREMVHRHIAFLYALKQGLRKSVEEEYIKYISEDEVSHVRSESNKANAILNIQTRELNKVYSSGDIDGFRFIELNKMLVNFCDGMGKSERIANTVFPTTYNYYTKLFTWIFIVFVTLASAGSLGAYSIIVGTLVGYVFLTTQKIGITLLNPFDDIITGIPLNQITRTIEINLLEALNEKDIPEPVQSVDGEYIM